MDERGYGVVGTERISQGTASNRRERLVQFVLKQGYCTVLELARRFEVSEMTIRRDVARLVDQRRLRAFHGGVASLAPMDMLGSDYGARDRSMDAAKRAIAARALHGVESGSVVAIDAGTTASRLASIIPSDRRLKVVTHSFPVVSRLATNAGVDLECLGGVFHREALSFAGPATLAAISNLHIQVLFLSASGLNDRGVFCGNGFDAITKRALIDVSDRVVLIADSSKFSTAAMVRICEWGAIDQLITDTGLRAADREMLTQYGLQVETVTAGISEDALEAVR